MAWWWWLFAAILVIPLVFGGGAFLRMATNREVLWLRVRYIVGCICGALIVTMMALSLPIPDRIAFWATAEAAFCGGWLGVNVARHSGWALLLGVIGWTSGFACAAYMGFGDPPNWPLFGLQATGLSLGIGLEPFLAARRHQ